MIAWNRLVSRSLSGLVLLMIGCETTNNASKLDQKNYGTVAPPGIEDTIATPPHRLSRKDYPFDSSGKYRTDWVGGSSESSSRRTASASTAVSKPQEKPSSPSSSATSQRRYHIVKTGDTLFSISRSYGVTLSDLRKLNSLDSYQVRKGSVLRIPSS